MKNIGDTSSILNQINFIFLPNSVYANCNYPFNHFIYCQVNTIPKINHFLTSKTFSLKLEDFWTIAVFIIQFNTSVEAGRPHMGSRICINEQGTVLCLPLQKRIKWTELR